MEAKQINLINERKPVWISLSQFYLDTELDDAQLQEILKVISESPYGLDDAKKIDFFELYPVLKYNAYSTAGEWEGFDEDWLVNKLESKFKGNSIFNRRLSGLRYWLAKRFTEGYWERLEKISQKRNL